MIDKKEVFVYNGTGKPPKETRRIRISGNVKAIPAEEFVEYDFAEVDFSKAQSLESIGKRAFTRCIFLKEVHLPTHLKRIETGAFMDCVNITELKFGESSSLEYMGKVAFYGCQCLREVNLPISLSRIDSGAFCACDGLTEVTFGESLLYIGKKAFARCRHLKEVHLPSSINRIEDGAFMECIKLTEVTFGVWLRSIGSVAFYGCESLRKVQMPPKLTRIESGTFCSCKSMVEVTLNKELQYIGNATFAKCTSLKEIHLTPNLVHIDADAFHSCKSITSVIFGESSLKSIGKTAFANCESLKEAHFPPSLNRIEEEAFSGCIAMMEVTFHQSALQSIGIQAFRRCGLIKVALPPSLKVIEKGAFSSCKNLRKADFSKVQYLEKMGENVLRGSSSIKETLLPSTASGPVSIHNFLNINDGRETPSYVISAKVSTSVNGTDNTTFKEARSLFNFEENRLFLGRYKLAAPPIHKSTTSVVIKALDTKMTEYYECEFDKYRYDENELTLPQFENALQDLMMVSKDSTKLQEYVSRFYGSISREEFAEFCVEEFGQLVALKFMKRKVQYERELNRRSEKALDKRFVVQIIDNHDEDNSKGLAIELGDVLGPHLSGSESAEDYCHIIVTPFADRTLDLIFRTERPNLASIRRITKEIGEAVAHLHSKGIVHGDLKLSNIIQINGRMSLINLDASADIVFGFVGSHFSSGAVPPEMIHQLKDQEETEKYLDYFREEHEDERRKRAPKYSTSPLVRGFVVRSFLEDEIDSSIQYQESDEMVRRRRSKPRREGLSMYNLVRAGRAFDVWSFGVLLYTLCSREPLFKVNSDDDITDGDSLWKLYNWGKVDLETSVERSIHNKAAKALLKSILKRSPAERPTMTDILQDGFFNAEENNAGKSIELAEPYLENQQVMMNDFLRMRASLNRAIRCRRKANDLLEGVINGVKIPKYFVFLPLFNEGNARKGFSAFLSNIKGATSLETKARLYFLCPISLRPVLSSTGSARCYHIILSEDWLQRYGHAILIGLMIVKVALTLGRINGLPASESEEGLLELMNFFSEMQDLVVEGLKGDEKDETSVNILLEQINDQYKTTTMLDGLGTAKHLKAKLQMAYDSIASRVTQKDGKLKKCGLVKTSSSDGSKEFVHPDMVQVFKNRGSTCFEMTWEQLEVEKSLLDVRVEKKSAPIVPPNDPGKEDSEQPVIVSKEKLVEMEDGIGASPSTTDSGSSQSVAPKEVFHQDVSHMNESKLQGGRSIVHEGWLAFQSSRFSFRWKERYVMIFENGNVACYHRATTVDDPSVPRTILFAVTWSALSDGCIELRSSNREGNLKRKARLSKRSPSTVEDWLQGNQWMSGQPEREDSNSAGTTSTKYKRARASRIDFTGQIIKS